MLHAAEFDEAAKLPVSDHNTVIIISLSKRSHSFFSGLHLRSLLKKQSINWLVNLNAVTNISTSIPQLMVPKEDGKPADIDAKLASLSLAVCSQYAKHQAMATYSLQERNVRVVPAFAGEAFQPISWPEKQSVKMEHTQGREYFLAGAGFSTQELFLSLLKAFSGFKKWQHSNMKLVVAGTLPFADDEEWKEKINTYKYRDDLLLLPRLPETEYAVLLGGAYAFVHMPAQDHDVVPLLQAMQCETPCISLVTDSLIEYAAAAAILVEAGQPDVLTEKMILLYKDERLRSQLIAAGTGQIQQFNSSHTVQSLMPAMPGA